MIDTTVLLREAYLRAAYAEIRAEEKNIERDRAFYDGRQGIVFTARQKEYLGDIAGALTDQALCNICRRAVDIPAERLALESISAGDEAGQAYADAAVGWWRSNSLRSWQAWLYEYALRDSAACLIVGWGGEQPTYTLNELYDGVSGQVRLHYDPDSGELAFASKRYAAINPATLLPTGKTRLTVYFADRIERYEDDRRAPDGWRLLTPEDGVAINPQPWLGRDGTPLGVPVIVFDNPGGSELDDILMPQKAMNKSLADLLAAQDFHGFPLLALVGYRGVVGADGKQAALKLAAGEAVTVPADGKIERVPGADLGPMLETGALTWIKLAAMIKGWPVYLWMHGEPPSGESLKVMEASLVAQVRRKQETFDDSWAQAFDMGRRLHRLYRGQDLPGELSFTWRSPETRQGLADAQSQQVRWDSAAIPTIQRWREAGYSEEQIAQMQAEESTAAAEMAARSSIAMMQAQQTFGGGGG
jgi:hypothetical protein